MINSLKLHFKVFLNFLAGAVMEDCGLISLTYLYGSFDGDIFPYHSRHILKKFERFSNFENLKSP